MILSSLRFHFSKIGGGRFVFPKHHLENYQVASILSSKIKTIKQFTKRIQCKKKKDNTHVSGIEEGRVNISVK